MLTRRAFAACALCAAGGFLAAGVEGRRGAAGLKRTLMKQTDGPMDGYVTVEMRSTSSRARRSRAMPIRASNPAMWSRAEPNSRWTARQRALTPGDGFQVPTRVAHGGKNGAAKTVVVSTYVVEKGKPLASPA